MLIDLVQIPQTRFKFMLKNSAGQITFIPIKAHTFRSLFLLFLLECRQIQPWSNSLFLRRTVIIHLALPLPVNIDHEVYLW